jgi:hypothetical protein
MKKIALLVPSRERIQKKIELINSIKFTANSLENIVLYLGTDSDDPTTLETNKIATENSFVKIVTIPSNGTFQNLGILWNHCARVAKEEILAMIGDDMVFKTKDWDKYLLDEFDAAPQDGLLMVHCNDGMHGARIAVNAFIHRSYMEITGYFMREEFPVDKVDIWLQQIFSAFGRLKYRDDILIEHCHWSFGKSSCDNVAKRMRSNMAGEISTKLWKELLPERVKEANLISSKLGIKYDIKKINNDLANG